MKNLICLLLTLLLFLSGTTLLNAQTFKSNQFVTKVGDAPEDQKPISGGPRQKAPEPPANIRDAIYDQFNIELNGFSPQELDWAWAKFWDVKHTKFFELAQGTRVYRTTGGSEVKGCTVYFDYYNTQELFNVILIHELGHIIQNCAGDRRSFVTKHNNIYLNGQNPLTGYGTPKTRGGSGVALSCFGYPAWGENYAELIAYYLNPTAKEQTVAGGGSSGCINNNTVPFADGKHQDYFDLAREILGEY